MSGTTGPAAPAARTPWLALAGILLVAAGLRLWGLDAHALWRDELCSLIRSDGHRSFAPPATGQVLAFLPVNPAPDKGALAVIAETNEFIPPLYFLGLRVWIDAFGSEAATLRGFSVAASVATVLIGALLAGWLGGRRACLIAALLLAVSPLEYRYAQEARPYALLGLCAMAATLAFVGLQSGRGSRAALWTLYTVSLLGVLGVHYTGLLVPAAHGLWYLLLGRPATLRPPRAALVAFLAGIAPLLWLLAWQIAAHRAESFESLHWLDATGSAADAGPTASRTRLALDALALGGGFVAGLQASPWLAAALALTVTGLAVAGVAGSRSRWLLLLLAVGGPLALAAADLAAGTGSTRVPRYAFVSSAFLWVAAGLGVARLRGWALALVLLFVVAGEASGTWRSRHRETLASDIEALAATMNAAGCDDRDLVVALLDSEMQIMELNQGLGGQPFELVVGADGRLSSEALQRDWRQVFVVSVPWRAAQDAELRTKFAQRFEERETLATARVRCTRFGRPDEP